MQVLGLLVSLSPAGSSQRAATKTGLTLEARHRNCAQAVQVSDGVAAKIVMLSNAQAAQQEAQRPHLQVRDALVLLCKCLQHLLHVLAWCAPAGPEEQHSLQQT